MSDTPHNLRDQLIAHVDQLLADRRKRNEQVVIERRGRNPQRRGYESHDQDDVNTAFEADRAAP